MSEGARDGLSGPPATAPDGASLTAAKALEGSTRGRFHGRRALVSLLALGAVALAPTASSFAYVQYQTLHNGLPVYFHWNLISVPITVYPNDLPAMTPDAIELAASSAAAAWSQDQLACTYLTLDVSASFDATHPAGSDHSHVLVFRSPWCDPAAPDLCQREALAVTSVFAGTTTGTIQDADIEVNTENFLWDDLAMHPSNGKQDLQNALTHEMGHFIGLDHNCFSPSVDPVTRQPIPRQIDNNGVAVPDCASAPIEVQRATMFNSANLGDLSKRTLEPDDQQAVCDIYPVGHPPAPVSDTGCNCGVAPGASAGLRLGLAPALLLSALTLCRPRRRRPRGS